MKVIFVVLLVTVWSVSVYGRGFDCNARFAECTCEMVGREVFYVFDCQFQYLLLRIMLIRHVLKM